ncbi:MAG: hypothetical protein VBE63_14700 [Lamprobacter sp.]|uniref:hypothetical protein n=1 Tax=Lamprobacter sp. TaxID=3100796 RepID=UPI002B2641D8|nr:hypothetical protein [Lamprobacter sp.]MEA3641173.1 hypothetical protein [Lamprobacter sp.]
MALLVDTVDLIAAGRVTGDDIGQNNRVLARVKATQASPSSICGTDVACALMEPRSLYRPGLPHGRLRPSWY